MNAQQLRDAAKFLEGALPTNAITVIYTEAATLERAVTSQQIARRTLEGAQVRVSVSLGDLAAALHWIEDHAWLSDAVVPAGVKALQAGTRAALTELTGANE